MPWNASNVNFLLSLSLASNPSDILAQRARGNVSMIHPLLEILDTPASPLTEVLREFTNFVRRAHWSMAYTLLTSPQTAPGFGTNRNHENRKTAGSFSLVKNQLQLIPYIMKALFIENFGFYFIPIIHISVTSSTAINFLVTLSIWMCEFTGTHSLLSTFLTFRRDWSNWNGVWKRSSKLRGLSVTVL